MRPERVAVIGSGVAGLTAAHLLQRRYDVTLIEADDRLGGHAHTHGHVPPEGGMIRVDSGFIVHNRATYPNLIRLFDELGVRTTPTGMSMSVRCDGCGLEYAGALGLSGVFAQPANAARPEFLRMLASVRRFHRHARQVVADGTPTTEPATERATEPVGDETTLGQFLRDGGYSPYFVNHFLVPVVSAVWSSAPATALEYPARYLFTFLANHGMLSVKGSHQWYTVAGGSVTYVDAVAKRLAEVRSSTPVRRVSVRADRSGVEVTTGDGLTESFDRAVVATHPDTALRLLDRPTEQQRAALEPFSYSRNETVLHQDRDVLPRRPKAHAAWNYRLPDCGAHSDRVLVTYDMNRLQHLPAAHPYLVTLNSTDHIDSGRVIARMVYEHPVYTPASVAAQKLLPSLNDDRLAFAGAYHGWGFHEDGCRSGVAAAAALGVTW